MKDYLIDMDNAISIISAIRHLIRSIDDETLSSKDKLRLRRLMRFFNILSREFESKKNEFNLSLLDYYNKHIAHLISDIEAYLNNPDTDFLTNILIIKFEKAYRAYRVLNGNLNINNETTSRAINSETYYNTKIAELEAKEAELKKALEITEGKSHEEINKAKKELEEANRKIQDFKNELEFKKKLEDAKEDWENNINHTFTELKTYLSPIRDEQDRLNSLFWAYLILSVLLVLAVIVIESIAVYKVVSIEGFPDFKQYITIYMPLPIAGALLWGFIYQMNRAQRQLVVGAKSIHNVEYVQGLLLSINQLAPTIDDGRSRINAAIDKLINNHLGQKGIDTEEGLIQEESKDSLPIDTVMKLMKEMKELSKKE